MTFQENEVDVIKKMIRKTSNQLNSFKKAIYIRLSYDRGEFISTVLVESPTNPGAGQVEMAVFIRGKPDSRLYFNAEVVVSTSYERVIYNYQLDFDVRPRVGMQFICKSFMLRDVYEQKIENLESALSYFKSLLKEGDDHE